VTFFSDAAPDAAAVVKRLSRLREQALEAWGEAQEESDRIMAALRLMARVNLKIEETWAATRLTNARCGCSTR
jgi:hypothetical protein